MELNLNRFRDNQRGKVYKAEQKTSWYWTFKAESRKEFYDFIDLVMQTELPNEAYEIKHTKQKGAYFQQRKVLVLNFASRVLQYSVALHEIAHAITRDEDEAHGPLFAYTFLNLINEYMGSFYADEFQKRFDECKVCYDHNRKYSKAAKNSWITKKKGHFSIPITPSLYKSIEFRLDAYQDRYGVSLSKTRLYVPVDTSREELRDILSTVCCDAFTSRQIRGAYRWKDRVLNEISL
jgi:hypothetical protein